MPILNIMTSRIRIVSLKFTRWITQLLREFRNALPHGCYLCHEETANYRNRLCETCRSDLPFPDQLCIGCSKRLNATVSWCGQCQQSMPEFTLVTASYYQTPVKQLLSDFKYKNQIQLAHELAHFLARRIYKLISQGIIEMPQAIQPVPLHWLRQNKRGFNQALLIANELSLYLHIPVIDHLKRQRSTRSQAQLDAKERQHNLDNAFVLKRKIPYDSIALVDDVYTTGATMREISATILTQQDIEIQHWAIARTLITD